MPAEFDFPAERQRRHLDAAQLRSERRARPLAQGALAQRRRPPRRTACRTEQAQREMTVIASRLATTYPGQQHRLGRARDLGAGTAGHDRPAGAAADFGGGRVPAADRLRQRREPDPGAALEPARRDRGARRARRRTRAAGAAGAGGKLRAVGDRRRARACSSPGPACASCTRCRKAACRACRTCASTAACCCSRSSSRSRVALVFGLVPAIQASRAGLRDTMNAFSGTTRGRAAGCSARSSSIEVALALMLLVGAGLMTRSFAQLMRVSPGFEPAQPARGADLPAAVEVPDRHRSHALLHGRDPPRRRRCPACDRRPA